MKMPARLRILFGSLSLMAAMLISLLATDALPPTGAQSINATDRDRGHIILKTLKNEIKKNYYDPTFHGLDLDALFKTADEKVDRATSVGQVLGIVAQTLSEFGDSHLFFIPPPRASRTDYGLQMQMVGDKCYVMAIKPGSDAEAKGLKPGDLIYSVSGFAPTRENMWKMKYLFYTLRPQPGLHLELQSPGGQPRQVDVMAKITQGKRVVQLTGRFCCDDMWELIREGENEDRLHRQRYSEESTGLFIWKMPEFNLTDQGVDGMMNKVRKRTALILDLRGNPGGYVVTLQRLLSYFFDRDVKMCDIKRRKEIEPMMTKTRGDGTFKGKLFVLIDSQSASSAEIFARAIQLEKRGTVIGDRSAGAVMEAMDYRYQLGVEVVVPYDASITNADLIMADGKSLEKNGVTPDELLLPTAADMQAKRDPVLARAAALAGVKLDPEKAGSMFPVEWRK
jgi:C-terminal processing protease CtpA/Prc